MDRMIELKVTKGGVIKKINVTQNMATMLFSDGIDAGSKQRLVENILSEQKRSENTQQRESLPSSESIQQRESLSSSKSIQQRESLSSSESIQQRESLSSSENSLQSTSSDCQELSSSFSSPEPVYQRPEWTESQESLLIDLRHEMDKSFTTTRNHLSLWQKITEKMQEILNVSISTTQAMYKYNALKKSGKRSLTAQLVPLQKNLFTKECLMSIMVRSVVNQRM
ncbi:uro-adherence factor A-like [Saccostrea cucullata]|uniref:uro-adherence factor A-like n=1 Tax=Saccostrea cuccullata TaxID=36930 RepID=UPI002ED569C7